MPTATKTRTRAEVPAFVEKATALDLFNRALKVPGTLHKVRPVGGPLSLNNMSLIDLQCFIMGIEPGPSATYKEWQAIGRQVKRSTEGGVGLFVCKPNKRPVPMLDANGNPVRDENGQPRSRMVLSGFSYIKSRFVYSQTTGPEVPLPETPFDLGDLITALEVEPVPFTLQEEECGGYAYGDSFAINPLWHNPLGVLFHEVAHIVLGHTSEGERLTDAADRTPRNVRELEAEGTAMLLLDLLGLPGEDESRGYMQNWNITGLDTLPAKSADRMFDAAFLIYKAGIGQDLTKNRV